MFRLVCIVYLMFNACLLGAYTGKGPDHFLVLQFSKPVEPHVLNEVTAYSFSLLEPLNVEKTLYRAGYNSSKVSDLQASEVLRKLPFFIASEVDGPIKLRKTIPNDTLFSKQWHLGIIKAAEAWDLTRSGVNRRGDTIVIAVVDDGLHINHPDFQGNIWINYADIMNNGIDDDNNGYIDDTYGWNFVNQNNDISDSTFYMAQHGTPVAGIIGARGNNITGVSGIMWHVKLMIVNVADTSMSIQTYQSDAIRAYSYVLHQRKLYNASNGQKGAFVVAANSSWGADNKQPNQTPLWCAMYDSLGKYGVLNASAVTNSYVPGTPVEVSGDIPTLCPSNHLITVAASNSTDGFFSSGYSTMNVDLSAPGSNVFSANAYTKQNILNNRIFGQGHAGTSFAAPMVTAAIGVLHSYACERILDTIRANPAKGNLLMRKFILEGVDVLPALAGKSVTSGRLNIKKSLQIMDQYCLGLVNIDKISTNDHVRLFPNPGNGSISLISAQPIVSVVCYDMTGKMISSVFNGQEVELPDAADGIYFIRIETGNGVQTYKYIKTALF